MSTDTQWEAGPDAEAVLDRLERWYHVPALLAVLAYMLWIRIRPRGNFIRDGNVYFSGNDAYYHFRTTMYSVENWPAQLYGDPWTHFPYGGNVGNFGSLMDQAVATVALVVGLGDPSPRLVAVVAALTPPVLAALCAILVYLLGKQLTGTRLGGLIAAGVLAIVPQGAWIVRGTVGFYDHHIAEAFMMTASVLAMTYAIATVRRERPVWEQVLDRDLAGLWPSVRASALAGLVLGLYLHTWAPGLFLIGVFGLFFLVAIALSVLLGDSPEYLAFAGAVSMTAGALTVLPWTLGFDLSSSQLSFLHVLLFLSVGAGCAVLAVLARYWDRESYESRTYPVAVGGLVVVSLAVAWVVLPGFVDSLVNGLSRILPIGQSETTLTVAEAQPMNYGDLNALGDQFYRGYGFTFFTAVVAMFWLGAKGTLASRRRSEYLLVAIWSLFLISMAITQVRFHYYLAIAVAVLNGWLVVEVVRLVDFPSLTAPEEFRTYHVLTVFAVLMLLVVPIASPIAIATASDATANQGPGEVQYWQGNLDWMSENTPEPGQYGDADGEMSYYGPFDEIDDYAYPEGAYGVMSWWDYGHWITVEGERIPNANPFQEGPRTASAYFQETNETRANLYLDALPANEIGGSDLYGTPTEELRDVVANRTEQEASEETRYVMIDDQMAGEKFNALARWTGPGASSYFSGNRYQIGGQNATLTRTDERYDETMLSRLYFDQASGLSHYRLVDEADSYSVVGGHVGSDGQARPSMSLGPIGGWDRAVQTAIQLQQANADGTAVPIGQGQYVYDAQVESSVRTFERVDGATITGQAEPNETVQAVVTLEADSGRQFNYAQQSQADRDGDFSMTVPYATTNELGPEDGYTNASVVANGTYTVSAGSGLTVRAEATDVSVPEPAIYDGEEIDVELEPVDTGDGNETDGNETGENGTDGNATETGTGDGGSTTDSEANTTSGASAAGSAPSGSSASASAPSVVEETAWEAATAAAIAASSAPLPAARIAG